MRVHAPWVRSVVLDDQDDGNYVIPNQGCVVLGGTHQIDDWDQVSGSYCRHLLVQSEGLAVLNKLKSIDPCTYQFNSNM